MVLKTIDPKGFAGSNPVYGAYGGIILIGKEIVR